jgi:uncharacterized membrane protein YqjE
VRLLWSLPKAAPALLRHIAAYMDLALLDLAQARREWEAEIVAGAVVAMCAMLALLFGCILVIAATWDTGYRLTAIAWMAGLFGAGAVVAALYRAKHVKQRSQLLSTVREQWEQDRVILEHILSDEE